MNRRSFFTRVAKAIIIASSAPVILREALCAKLPVVEPIAIVGSISNCCVNSLSRDELERIFMDEFHAPMFDGSIKITQDSHKALYDFIVKHTNE